MCQVVLSLFQVFLKPFHKLVSLEAVVLRNTLDFDLRQPDEVIFRDFPVKLFFIRFQPLINPSQYILPGFGFLNVAVYAVFNEYLLQR